MSRRPVVVFLRTLALPLPVARMVAVLAIACATASGSAGAADAEVPAAIPESASPRYMQSLAEAQALAKDRQFDVARVRLLSLVAERPREPRARFLLGLVQTDLGTIDAAIATFTALTRDYPELPEPYNNLAVIYAQRGQYDDARIALETALKSAPEWAVAHENLGDIYARLAAGEYDRATRLDRDSKSAAAKLTLARNLLSSSSPPKSSP